MDRACVFIRENPDAARTIAGRNLKMEDSLLTELSAIYHFDLSLDQSFLLTLENQSKWAIKRGLTDRAAVPNFLDYIYLDALTSVKPENVTIIR